MGLLSGLFSNKNQEKNDIISKKVDSFNEELIIFTPHKLLIEISDDLKDIDKIISETSNDFAYNSKLTLGELDDFLINLNNKTDFLTLELNEISDPSYVFKKIKQTCAEISDFNFLNNPKKYANFVNCNDFVYLPDQAIILETIFSNSLKFENSDKMFNLFRNCNKDFNNILKKSKILNETNANLTTEIINYTNAVNSVRAKNRLSVDWNGKKPALMNLGNQLNSKRSDFITQENVINQQISELYTTYYSAHNLFKLHCFDIIDILEQNSDNLTSNYDNQVKLLTNSIKKLKISKNKLIDFIDNFTE